MYIHASVDPPLILSLNHPLPTLSPSSLSFCFDRPPSLRAQTELNNDGTNRFTPRPRGLRLVRIKMPAVKNTRNRLLELPGALVKEERKFCEIKLLRACVLIQNIFENIILFLQQRISSSRLRVSNLLLL